VRGEPLQSVAGNAWFSAGQCGGDSIRCATTISERSDLSLDDGSVITRHRRRSGELTAGHRAAAVARSLLPRHL